MPDLITPSRAIQNPTLAALNESNPSYLPSLISAASDAIRRTCGRDFSLASYSEYYSGGIYIREPLRLRQFPVVEITRVAAGPRAALLVQNLDAATNQRATAETTALTLTLFRVASAAMTTNNLDFASHPTIASLAAAVNALGSGWSATVQGNFANWPSADLKPLQGAVSVFNGGRALEIYTEAIQPFADWPGNDADGAAGSTGWRLDDETGELFARFPRGRLNIRIDYRAGFAAVPQAVQEACVQLVQDLYQAGLVNNTVKKSTLGPASVELKDQATAVSLSPKVRLLISPYVDYSKVIFR